MAEQLDAHRKARQAEHPGLTMTGMYNVLEKLRSGEVLTAKERTIHEQGLVSVLKQLHDDLDIAVAAAYGWPFDLTEEEVLTRLVALNAERAREEAEGRIRWLRPDFQNPQGSVTEQTTLPVAEEEAPKPKNSTTKQPWPKTLPDQMRALRSVLENEPTPLTAAELTTRFLRARESTISELLETLVILGRARISPCPCGLV